jgi:hypothetical protein
MNKLIKAAQAVVSNASDEGCSDDLTVTSKRAVAKLQKALLAHQEQAARPVNDRVESIWKCPSCDKLSYGHSFKWFENNGTPTCDCGDDMCLNAIIIDGVSQKA